MEDSVYAAPRSELLDPAASEAYRHKRYVISAPDAAWPGRCYKCNTTSTLRKKVKLTYVNPWIYLSLLITPLITIILALIFQKKFTVDLPICERHLKRRRNFVLVQWAIVMLMIAGFVVGTGMQSDLLFFLSFLLILVVVILAIAGRMVFLAKYKSNRLWIRGTGKEFRDSLPVYDH